MSRDLNCLLSEKKYKKNYKIIGVGCVFVWNQQIPPTLVELPFDQLVVGEDSRGSERKEGQENGIVGKTSLLNAKLLSFSFPSQL